MNARDRDAVDYVESFIRDARSTSRSAEAKLDELALYLKGMSERIDRYKVAASDRTEQLLLDELAAARHVLTSFEQEHRASQETLDRTRLVLERERAKYLDLFESAPDANILTSARAVVREANSASGVLLNMPPRFLIGKPLLHFVARQDTRVFRERLRELEEHPGNDNFELRIRPRHGSVLRAEVAASPVRGLGGACMGLRWVLRAKSTVSDAEAAQALPLELALASDHAIDDADESALSEAVASGVTRARARS